METRVEGLVLSFLNLRALSRSVTEFPSLNHLLRRMVEGCRTFLDVGCGRGSPIAQHARGGYLVGVDLFHPYILASKQAGLYSESVLGDIRYLQFRPKSFDCVSALDVIEHLTKDEGYALIEEMERLARKRVIVFTPKGFNPKEHLEDDNPLQVHRSRWRVDEMRDMGYRVYGVTGYRIIRGEWGSIRLKPAWFWYRVSGLTQKVTYFAPRYAFQILCVKRLDAS